MHMISEYRILNQLLTERKFRFLSVNGGYCPVIIIFGLCSNFFWVFWVVTFLWVFWNSFVACVVPLLRSGSLLTVVEAVFSGSKRAVDGVGALSKHSSRCAAQIGHC